MKRPILIHLLTALMLFESIGAIYGGASLLFNPKFMPIETIANSPFSSFLIPGLVLLIFLGIYPLLIVYAIYANPRWKFLTVHKNWAWTHTIYYCIITLIWIAIQECFVEFSYFQTMILFIAISSIIIALTPQIMKHYKIIS